MRTKKDIKFLTKLLNIEGIKVISHRQHEGIGIILQVNELGRKVAVHVVGQKATDYIKIIDT
jgi:hypothetical protein